VKALHIRKIPPISYLKRKNASYAKRFKTKHCIERQKVIDINTGAGSKWPRKKWDKRHTIELIDSLALRLKAAVILFSEDPMKLGETSLLSRTQKQM